MSGLSLRRLNERADLSVPRGTPQMGARYDADAFGDPDEGCPQHGDNRGSDLATCVRRYGATTVLDQVASRGHSISTVLLGYAEQSASDLLVVGAYSHPRFKEVLLGGTTRTLLEKTSMPTLMSR